VLTLLVSQKCWLGDLQANPTLNLIFRFHHDESLAKDATASDEALYRRETMQPRETRRRAPASGWDR